MKPSELLEKYFSEAEQSLTTPFVADVEIIGNVE